MQALIFDLDDTLLDTRKNIGPRTRHALMACSHAGFRLVIATSRPIRAVQNFIDPAFLSYFTLITLNGSILFPRGSDQQPRIIGRLGGDLPALIAEIVASEQNAHLTVEFDGWHFASNRQEDPVSLSNYHAATPDQVLPLEAILTRDVSKIAVDGCGQPLNGCLDLAPRHQGLKFIPALADSFINIVPAGIDKSTTLKILAEEEGIDLSASYAFGDDIPDIEMFQIVGNPIAMGNAVPGVKKVARHIIGHCDDEAIGAFLEKTFGAHF